VALCSAESLKNIRFRIGEVELQSTHGGGIDLRRHLWNVRTVPVIHPVHMAAASPRRSLSVYAHGPGASVRVEVARSLTRGYGGSVPLSALHSVSLLSAVHVTNTLILSLIAATRPPVMRPVDSISSGSDSTDMTCAW
jgi:hypothetical protein